MSINLLWCSQSINSLMYVYYADLHLFLWVLDQSLDCTSSYYCCPSPSQQKKKPVLVICEAHAYVSSKEIWKVGPSIVSLISILTFPETSFLTLFSPTYSQQKSVKVDSNLILAILFCFPFFDCHYTHNSLRASCHLQWSQWKFKTTYSVKLNLSTQN